MVADNNLGNAANSLSFNGGTLFYMNGFGSSRNVTLNAGGGTFNTGNNSVTLANPGVISGTGALTKTGTGLLTLTGTNTYSGGTFLNAGTVSISTNANLGDASGALSLANGSTLQTTANLTSARVLTLGATGGSARGDNTLVSGTLNVASGTTLEWTGKLTGTGRLEKTGAGTLFLNNTTAGNLNDFSGGIYLHDGITRTGAATQFGGGTVTQDNGAILISNQVNVFGGTFLIGTGGAVRQTDSGFNTYRVDPIVNVTSQSGGLTLQGSGGKTGLGGANTFTGNVVINSGHTLSISRDANLGSASNQITLNDSTLAIEDGADGAGTAYAATFATGRQINLTGTSTIDVRNTYDALLADTTKGPNAVVRAANLAALGTHTNTLTANGLLTGSGQLIKSGAGTLVLTNSSNNFTGGTTINGGTLSSSEAAALGSASGLLTINPTGTLQATGSYSTSRAVVLGGTGGASSGGTIDVTGSNILTRTGVISGSGSLTKTGTGTLSLNAANTFTGDFYINGGTVSTTSNQSLGPQPTAGSPLYTVHMANGTTLQTVVSSAVGNRQFELVSGTATLDVTGSFIQQRNGLVYGAGGLIKAGTGTHILTNANTYTGGTTINNGTLQVNNTSGSATGTGAVTVNSGGTLSGLPTPAAPFNVAGTISGAVTINSGGTLAAQSGTTFTLGNLTLNTGAISDFDLGALTATPMINITSTDGLNLAGASSIVIHNIGGLATGTYRLFDYTGTALSSIGNLSLGSTPGSGFTYSLSNNQSNTSIDLLVSATSNQWGNDASGNWSAGSNWSGGTPNAQGAQANLFSLINVARTVTVDDAFTIGSLAFDNVSAYSVVGDGVNGHGLTFANGGVAAIEVLSGSHTISAPISLTDNLDIAAITGTALTINSAISENSAGRTLTIDGAGTVTLGGTLANTYSGLTRVTEGTLNLNKTVSVNAIGAGGVQVDSGTVLALLASHQIADTATAAVNGTFALGTSSETIGALNGGGSVTLGTGSVLTVGAANNLNSLFGGVISGAGTITKAGTGTLVLNGTNTFGGSGQTVSINAGSVQVAADSGLGNAANSLTFNGGALVFANGFTSSRNVILNAGGGTMNTGNNAVTLANSGVISGTGALTKTGSGTLTLSGTNTYQGGTVLNAGSLSITSEGNVGTGSVQLNNGATLVTNGTFDFTQGFVLGAPGGTVQRDGLAVSGIINVQSGTLTQTTNGITDGGAGGRLMKIGAGTLDLQVGSAYFGGNTAFSGGVYVHEGTLITTAIGSLGDNLVNTVDNGATLIGNVTVGGIVSLGEFRVGTGGAFGGVTAGNVNFGNGVVRNVDGQDGGFTVIGPGKLGFGGNNTFVGTVVIGNPATPLVPVTLSISRDVNLGAAGNQLTIGNGSTLMIEDGIDATQPVGSAAIAATFSTNRQINLTGSVGTIDVANTGDAINFNPAFNPGGLNTLAEHVNVFTVNGLITGSGQLIKSGAGTLVLGNAGNNYTGGTVINGGMLSTSNAAALGAADSSLTINPTGILQATATTNTSRLVTLGGTGSAESGGTFDVTGAAVSRRTGVISGSGSLTKTGTGTLSLRAINTYSGVTVVNAGILDLNVTGGQSIAGDLIVNGGTAQLAQDSQINSAKNLVVSGGTFNLQGFNQTLANVQLTSGSINGSGGTLTSANTFDLQSGSVSAALAGSVALDKTTAGTLTLAGANTFTGGTTVNAGTLELTGSLASGVTITSSGTLTGTGTVNGAVGNAGALNVTTGTFTLEGESSHLTNTGAVSVSNSTLSIGGDYIQTAGSTSLKSGTITAASIQFQGGTFVDPGTSTLNGNVTNSAPFTVNDNSTLNVNGNFANTGTGAVSIIENSTMNVTTGHDMTNAGTVNIASGSTIALADGSYTQSAGSTVIDGALAATNVIVNGGTVSANADGALASTAQVTLNTGGTLLLGGAGTDKLANTAAVELAGGTLDLNGQSEGTAGVDGAGTLTLTANSTLDFGADGEGNSLVRFFAIGGAISLTDNVILQITNWQGTAGIGGGVERLLFGGSASEFTSRFSQNEVTFDGIEGYSAVQFGDYYEIATPGFAEVPEPLTVFGGLMLLGMAGYRERRRVGAWLARG